MRRGTSRSPGRSPGRGSSNIFGSATCARARETTEREIQRHMRTLSAAKEQIRRAKDDVSKEAGACTATLREGGQMHSNLSHSIATYSRHLHDDSSEAMTTAIRKHVQAMQASGNELGDLMGYARQAQEELTVNQQKLQHLESLVDCAVDIDIQCATAYPVSKKGTHSVVVSGSPLFPGLTIDQSDQVLAESADLCARSGRLTQMLRKVIATSMNLSTNSMSGLSTITGHQSKILAEAYAVQLRQFNGIVFEHNKATNHLEAYEQETEYLRNRLNQVSKTLQLRSNASQSLALSRGRADVVTEALSREKTELEARLAELNRKTDQATAQLRRLEEERAAIEQKMMQVRRNAEACQKTQQLANELVASSASPGRSPRSPMVVRR